MRNKPKHIFLVDDDIDDRNLFQEAMHEVDPHVKLSMAESCDMFMLLDKTQPNTPDLILLDMNMPGANGLECLEEIKSMLKYGHIPVLIYSTSANPAQVEKTYKKGAALYLQKPSSFTGIKKLMHKLFEIDLPNHTNLAVKQNQVLSA